MTQITPQLRDPITTVMCSSVPEPEYYRIVKDWVEGQRLDFRRLNDMVSSVARRVLRERGCCDAD